jgi:ribosomal protein S18 acetylase RimI-like enzyme/pyrimidine operon attenuation protein/uracil phosphoribosyltransferase
VKTLLIGSDEVHAYLADLVQRLDPVPLVWCPITQSGREIATEAAFEVEKFAKANTLPLPSIAFLPIETDAEGRAKLLEPSDAVAIAGASVLLIDGAIHSGRTMASCASLVLAHKPASLASYAVVLKRSSRFIPTLWGVMTDETDRTHFLLNKIPNNRLNAGGKPQPHIHLRRLEERDCATPIVKSGLASIERVTWSDRLWQMTTTRMATTTYVLERGEQIVGFLTVHIDEQSSVTTVSEIVVDSAEKDQGYGGVLIRFADTLARQAESAYVRLNAIEEKVSLYEKFGYYRSPGASELRLDRERYYPMERPVLYHHVHAAYAP